MRLAIAANLGTIALLAWLYLGGLIAFVPGTITAGEMQNFYLARILWYGAMAALFQFAAIGLLLFVRTK